MRRALLLLLLVPPIIFEGCSATSPRFTSGGSRIPAADSPAGGTGKTGDKTGTESADPLRREAAPSTPVLSRENNPAIDRHKVLNDIMERMGVPYSEGGSDSEGTDCSGFTAAIYRDAIGREIPRSCREQYAAGVPVPRGKLKFGDLVFFNIDGRPLSHVGIYVGDGLFAHASLSLGITVSLLEAEYYARSYAGARRVVH